MKVLSVGRYSSTYTKEADLLDANFTSLEWADALEREVDMVLSFGFVKDSVVTQGGKEIYLVKDRRHRLLQKLYWPFYKKVVAIARKEDVGVLHIHNLGDLITIFVLSRLLRRQLKVIVQDHGSLPNWKKRMFSFCYRRVDAFVFCAAGQEEPWVSQGILPAHKCHYILENSSAFKYIDRKVAREKTGLKGNPVAIHVGNLTPLKDPIAVLKAISEVVKKHPDFRLYLIYRLEAILSEVEDYIRSHDLIDNVVILGSKKRDDLEMYYNSADIYISASHKEGSGYTAIEAMSCGAIPILTDIPSFRLLNGAGKVGMSWTIGRSEELAAVIETVVAKPIEEQREEVLDHFNKELSFEKIRSDYLKLCQKLVHI